MNMAKRILGVILKNKLINYLLVLMEEGSSSHEFENLASRISEIKFGLKKLVFNSYNKTLLLTGCNIIKHSCVFLVLNCSNVPFSFPNHNEGL
jgi:hypothetical protein